MLCKLSVSFVMVHFQIIVLMDDGIYLEAQYSVEFSENSVQFGGGEVYDGGFGDFNGEFQAPTSEFQVPKPCFCRLVNTGMP
jgi:hypothetical protein